MLGPGKLQWINGEESCLDHDPELWFSHDDGDQRKALLICEGCPQRQPCYDYALNTRAVGIWGGTTDDQRSAMRLLRQRKGRI